MAAMMEGAVSAALVSGQYAGVIDEFEQHEMIMGEDVPDVRALTSARAPSASFSSAGTGRPRPRTLRGGDR